MLIPIPTSRASGKKLHTVFSTKGGPIKLSFGLGGWALGKGFIEFKQFKINKMPY